MKPVRLDRSRPRAWQPLLALRRTTSLHPPPRPGEPMPSSASSDTPSAGSPGTPSPGAPGVPETAENATPPDDIDVTVENAAEILAAEDDSPPRHRGGASAGHRRRHLRGPAVRRLPSGLLRRRRAQGDAGPNPAHRGHQGRGQCGQVHRSARDLLLLARTHLQRHQCQAHRRIPLRLPEARRQQRFAHHSAGRPQGQEDRRALPVQLGLRLLRHRPVRRRTRCGSRERRHRLGDH